MAKSPSIAFVGAATVDMIFGVDTLPAGPGKVMPHALAQIAHGMATSAATAVARLGGRAMLITRIGDDALGDGFMAEIEAEGVDCRLVQRYRGVRTPLSAVIVDRTGERLAIPYYDPGLGTDADWITEADLDGVDAVQADIRWPQAAARVLDMARKAGKIAMLDADIGPTDIIVDLGRRATHIVFAEPAALSVSGKTTIAAAVPVLDALFEGFVAVTGGAEGCFWMEDGRVVQQRPPAVQAVDTLAAGDVFHGAFTLALVEGQPLVEAIAFANAAAAISCTVFGGRIGAPTREAVLALLASRPDGAASDSHQPLQPALEE